MIPTSVSHSSDGYAMRFDAILYSQFNFLMFKHLLLRLSDMPVQTHTTPFWLLNR